MVPAENSGCFSARKAVMLTALMVTPLECAFRSAWQLVQWLLATSASAALPRCSMWHSAQATAALALPLSTILAGCGAPSWQPWQARSGAPLNNWSWHTSQRCANKSCASETGPLAIARRLPPTPNTSGTLAATAAATSSHASRLRATASSRGRFRRILMNYYGAKELAESCRTVRKNTLAIAQDIPAEKYNFRAAENTRSVGE